MIKTLKDLTEEIGGWHNEMENFIIDIEATRKDHSGMLKLKIQHQKV